MAKNMLVVMSNAKPGRDDEFNDWYSNHHMGAVINKLDGFATAQRFELVDSADAPTAPFRYLAIYEIDDDDMPTAIEQFAFQGADFVLARKEGREPVLTGSDALATDKMLHGFFTSITDRITPDRLASGSPDS